MLAQPGQCALPFLTGDVTLSLQSYAISVYFVVAFIVRHFMIDVSIVSHGMWSRIVLLIWLPIALHLFIFAVNSVLL